MSTSKPQSRPGVPPAGQGANGAAGSNAGPNPYARFIPREELGNFSAWAPQTFEPRPADQPDVGVRKPTLAERAAAEMRPNMKPQQPAQHAPQAKGQAAGQAAGQGAPAQNGAAAGAKPAARRPVVGGMPGQAEAQEREAARAAAGTQHTTCARYFTIFHDISRYRYDIFRYCEKTL